MRNAGLIQRSFFEDFDLINGQAFSYLGQLEVFLILFLRETRRGCFQSAARIFPEREKSKGRKKVKNVEMPCISIIEFGHSVLGC